MTKAMLKDPVTIFYKFLGRPSWLPVRLKEKNYVTIFSLELNTTNNPFFLVSKLGASQVMKIQNNNPIPSLSGNCIVFERREEAGY